MTDSTAYPVLPQKEVSGGLLPGKDGEGFGTPNAKDEIARIERGINEVVDRATQHFESVVDRIAPRPIGSTKLPPGEQFRDYLMTIAAAPDPVQAGTDWVTEHAKSVGVMKALSDFLDMVTENEKRLASFQEKDDKVLPGRIA